jgi:hypothetical protein
VVPASDEGVTWADDAIALVVEVSKGYPYFRSSPFRGGGTTSRQVGEIVGSDVGRPSQEVTLLRATLGRD